MKCNKKYEFNIMPPDGTYKCEISTSKSCSESGTISLLSNDILINSKDYSFCPKEIKKHFHKDWYGNKFGLKYVPIENLTNKGDQNIELEVIFHTTNSGMNKITKHFLTNSEKQY